MLHVLAVITPPRFFMEWHVPQSPLIDSTTREISTYHMLSRPLTSSLTNTPPSFTHEELEKLVLEASLPRYWGKPETSDCLLLRTTCVAFAYMSTWPPPARHVHDNDLMASTHAAADQDGLTPRLHF
jgi:hypothetical protein